MATKIVKIALLKPGQEVGLMNCRETGRVVSRVAPGRYLVNWKGSEIETNRRMLAVWNHGAWRFGPYSADG
jgi:hypothetical protein